MKIDITGEEKPEVMRVPPSVHNGHIVAHLTNRPLGIEKGFFDHLEGFFLFILKINLALLALACLYDYMQW